MTANTAPVEHAVARPHHSFHPLVLSQPDRTGVAHPAFRAAALGAPGRRRGVP